MKKLLLLFNLYILITLAASSQITNVNIGSGPNAGNGDPLRVAFAKLNANDNYIMALIGTNGTVALGLSLTGSNGAAAIFMLGLDGSGHLTTNAVPTGGGLSFSNILGTPVIGTNLTAAFTTNGSGVVTMTLNGITTTQLNPLLGIATIPAAQLSGTVPPGSLSITTNVQGTPIVGTNLTATFATNGSGVVTMTLNGITTAQLNPLLGIATIPAAQLTGTVPPGSLPITTNLQGTSIIGTNLNATFTTNSTGLVTMTLNGITTAQLNLLAPLLTNIPILNQNLSGIVTNLVLVQTNVSQVSVAISGSTWTIFLPTTSSNVVSSTTLANNTTGNAAGATNYLGTATGSGTVVENNGPTLISPILSGGYNAINGTNTETLTIQTTTNLALTWNGSVQKFVVTNTPNFYLTWGSGYGDASFYITKSNNLFGSLFGNPAVSWLSGSNPIVTNTALLSISSFGTNLIRATMVQP
jgi:hypothetical protein